MISACFFAGATGWSFLSWLIGRKAKGRCVILYYHCILPAHRSRFASQMDLLLRRAIPVSVDRSQPLAAGKHYAAVTFDDGFASVAEQALPELIKRGIPATIFVTSDLLGQTPEWNGYPDRFMSLDELRALPADLVTLGSHTQTHPFLPRLNEREARDEISLSRAKLAQMFGREFTLFAFPYGAFNNSLIHICRESGYQRIFTTLPYVAELGFEEFVSGRVSAEPTDWQVEFYLKLYGAYRWLPTVSGAKKRLKSMFISSAVDQRLRPQSP